jgi:hypothetical protein
MYRLILAMVVVQLVLPSSVLARGRAPDPPRLKLLSQVYQQPPPQQPYHQPVYAAEPPSSGVGYIVAGSILVGVGALNLATAPICKVDDFIRDPETQDICLYTSLIFGGTCLAVGIPLLVVGIGKRRAYKEWQAQHPVVSQLLTGMKVAVGEGGKGVLWEVRF